MEAVFDRIAQDWGKLDFVIHSIAFSPKDTLHGRVTDAPRDGLPEDDGRLLLVLPPHGHLAEPLMQDGGTLFTMTYYGAQMVVENYNIMGVAQGRAGKRRALCGGGTRPQGHPRPRDLARPAGHPRRLGHRASSTCCWTRRKRSAGAQACDDRRGGRATAFLAHDAAQSITGQAIYIDGGYHIID